MPLFFRSPSYKAIKKESSEMLSPSAKKAETRAWFVCTGRDRNVILLSLFLQLVLGLFFGHAYDMRIFMATGYLVATGQNPYIAQDLTSVFHNDLFRGMTSIGYPPPWPIFLGFIYYCVYHIVPNLMIYNLSIKIPVIAANIGLAFVVANVLMGLGSETEVSRRAWVFLLLNPLLLYFATAWGQIDSIVALFSLIGLVLLKEGKIKSSAILIALGISLKPIALPIVLVVFVYLLRKSLWRAMIFSIVFVSGLLLFCVAPFVIFRWDPSVILQNWNAHFTVAGGMSMLTFYELVANSYQLTGLWWLLGMVWILALGLASLTLRYGIGGFEDLLKKTTGLVMVFFLTLAWLSEPNVILVLPFIVILTFIGELDRLALLAIWILPLVFTVLNTSLPQLLFPSFPAVMNRLLMLMDNYRSARLVARSVVVFIWQIVGWWIVFSCLRKNPELVKPLLQ
jgi:Gpi18-like mannosyltransferase